MVTHCNILQHTATHMQRTVMYCNALQQDIQHSVMLANGNALQHTATYITTHTQYTVMYCNALQQDIQYSVMLANGEPLPGLRIRVVCKGMYVRECVCKGMCV